ncbi:MAG: phosphatidate cytidylyltransferase [Treponema sp.]|jgi:dolichol kinase|nr:phosphatidate cytidylyltransferase [Treponema sp.]
MSDLVFRTAAFSIPFAGLNAGEFRSEILRKSLHFLIGLSPALAAFNFPATVALLAVGILGYVQMESLRVAGIRVPLVSGLTDMASRPRDRGRFVLGPVTLGLGALLALVMYPSPAASIAIYALAFGDGFASLVGRLLGRVRPAFLRGKSLEGSLACFAAVLASAYGVSRDYRVALVAAVTATVTEALPLKDYDNLVLPLVVGLVASIAL